MIDHFAPRAALSHSHPHSHSHALPQASAFGHALPVRLADLLGSMMSMLNVRPSPSAPEPESGDDVDLHKLYRLVRGSDSANPKVLAELHRIAESSPME